MATFAKRISALKSLKARGVKPMEKQEDKKESKESRDSQLSKLFVTSPEEIDKQYSAQQERREARTKEMSKQTFRIKDGEEKYVWFSQKTPILGVNIHYLYVGGRVHHIVCTQPLGECAICDAGHRPSFLSIYDIVDCTGYEISSGKDQGKTVNNFHCYYLASDPRHTAIQKMFKRVESEDVQSHLISVERRGSGANTTHLFAIDDPSFSPPQEFIDETPSFDDVAADWGPSPKSVMEDIAQQYSMQNKDSGVS